MRLSLTRVEWKLPAILRPLGGLLALLARQAHLGTAELVLLVPVLAVELALARLLGQASVVSAIFLFGNDFEAYQLRHDAAQLLNREALLDLARIELKRAQMVERIIKHENRRPAIAIRFEHALTGVGQLLSHEGNR